ncbi:hypothetical protein NPIL_352801 [Nephila pilipes]|uniref:Uncharacterized protein n=1 Tax=Nephila pilipes TaxID=299642 RepID=A0A8X6UUJ4_NEPPI|nr:hypothetical protein NPIL_329351 [Nephila pilipes]GFU51839.1 hypothetical protein NPIL_352801 [Nephila pilipes]
MRWGGYVYPTTEVLRTIRSKWQYQVKQRFGTPNAWEMWHNIRSTTLAEPRCLFGFEAKWIGGALMISFDLPEPKPLISTSGCRRVTHAHTLPHLLKIRDRL